MPRSDLRSPLPWLCCGLLTALLGIAGLSASAAPASAHPSAAPKYIVAGYVFPQNRALAPAEIDARKLTRVNYAFANIQDGKIVEGFSFDKQNFATLVALKQTNPSLTVLVSVGGWLWSGNFSEMALTAQSRSVFIRSVVDFIERHQLDGLDIDWEYPAMEGATKNFRPEDTNNFTLLLEELHKRFAKEQTRLHRRLYLTIAAGSSSEFLAHTQMRLVAKYVDTVNLMAYDYYEPGSEPLTGHHAPLFTNPADPRKVSADRSVKEFEAAGVPAAKLVLGVPFYGHVWGEVADVSHGLYQPGKPVPNAYAKYGSLSATWEKDGFTRYWDAEASVPYLYNPATKIFVSYEDPQSLAGKCRYIERNNLAGVMFWDYMSDPSGALLTAIDTTFHEAPAAKGSAK